MVSNNDDVQTLVQSNLLESIHELTHDLIHTLDCFN